MLMDEWKIHQREMLLGDTVKRCHIDSNIVFCFHLGFDVPANYDDVGLNCGGLSIQKAYGKFSERIISICMNGSLLGGKCGVCGDSYGGPRDHELGGKYATNTIVRHYALNSIIEVKILVRRNSLFPIQ